MSHCSWYLDKVTRFDSYPETVTLLHLDKDGHSDSVFIVVVVVVGGGFVVLITSVACMTIICCNLYLFWIRVAQLFGYEFLKKWAFIYFKHFIHKTWYSLFKMRFYGFGHSIFQRFVGTVFLSGPSWYFLCGFHIIHMDIRIYCININFRILWWA